MAKFEVNIRGAKYEIEAPDENQAATAALKLSQQPQHFELGQSPADLAGNQRLHTREQPSPAAMRSPLENLATSDVAGDVAASAPSASARGALDLVGLPGTIGDAVSNGGDWLMEKAGIKSRRQAMGELGLDPSMPASGEKLKGYASDLTGGATDYQAKTTPGKFTSAVSEFLPSAMAFGPASVPGLVKNAVVPAVSSEGAGELAQKYAPGLEPLARVGGAVAGGGVANMLKDGGVTKLPTAAEIKANAGYAALKEPMKAARIDQSEYQNIITELGKVVSDFGPVPELHGPISTILLRHAQDAAKGGASLQDLEIMRRSLLNAGKNPMNPSAGELSGQLIDKLDEAVDNISAAKQAAAGEMGQPSTVDALREARSVWATGKKSEIIERAMADAKGAASGVENGLRVEFRRILKSPTLSRKFSDTERMAMEQVRDGTFKGNMLRLLGGFGVPLDNARNFLGTVMGGGVGAAIGSAIAGPAGAAIGGPLLMGIGTAAKAASSSLTQKQAQIVEALVKAGPKAGEMFAKATAELSAADRTKILRAFQQGQSAYQVPAQRERAPR